MKAKRTTKAPSSVRLLQIIRVMCAYTVVTLVAASQATGQGLKDVGRVTINAASPQSIVKQLSVPPGTAQMRIFVTFQGDKTKWWFVRILSVSEGTEIFFDGEPPGHKADEKVNLGAWYSIQDNLPLTVYLSKKDSRGSKSTKIEYTLGYTDDAVTGKTPAEGTNKHYSIEVYWGQPGKVTFGANQLELQLSDKNNPKEQFVALTSEDPLWKFVQFNPPQGVALTVSKDKNNDADSITVAPGSAIDPQAWYGFRGRLNLMASCDNPELSTAMLEAKIQTRDVETLEGAKEAIRRGVQGDSVATSLEVRLQKQKGFFDSAWGVAIEYLPVTVLVLIILLGGAIYFAMNAISPVGEGGPKSGKGGDLDFSKDMKRRFKPGEYHAKKADGFWQKIPEGFGGPKKSKTAKSTWVAKLNRDNQATGNSTQVVSQSVEPQAAPSASASSVAVQQQAAGGNASNPEFHNDRSQPANSKAIPAQSPSQEGRGAGKLFPDPKFGEVYEQFQGTGSAGNRRSAQIDIQQVRDLINSELSRRSLTEKMEARVKTLIEHREKSIRVELEESRFKSDAKTERLVEEFEKKLVEHELVVLDLSKGAIQQVARGLLERLEGDQQSVCDLLTKEINGLRAQLSAAEQQFAQKLEQSNETQDPNRLYSKLFGHLFSAKIGVLQDGVFQDEIERVSQMLDESLKTDIPRGEVLTEITNRAEGIRQSLDKLKEKTSSLASGVFETQMNTILESAASIAEGSKALKLQLQSGAPELNVRLRMPISSNGARSTFIEELGFAIKRELDRISDPAGYYRRKLEQLVTGDIINLAETCDTQAGGPDKNREVEQALHEVFKQAGLRSILPRRGEPFDPAEQTLIQIITKKSGESQTVAEVVSRGFAYKNGQKEVLLRRAGVKIYR